MSFFHLIDQTWFYRFHGSFKIQGVNTWHHFARYSVAACHKRSHLWNYIQSISHEIDVGYWELERFPGITCLSRNSQYGTSGASQVAEFIG